MKVKVCTHGLFADNHLFHLHHLCDVVGSRFERCSARPVIDADENISVYVLTTVNTCQQITMERINN